MTKFLIIIIHANFAGAGHEKTRSQTGYASQAPPNTGDGQSRTRTQTDTNADNQSGPGFWSGAGIGSVFGYLFGSRGNRGHGYYRRVSSIVNEFLLRLIGRSQACDL